MDKIFTAEDLKKLLHQRYPDVEDDRLYRHCEHPMTAAGIVLLSAAITGMTDVGKLVLFTGYSRRFISAVALNMENNQLWVDGKYAASSWLSPHGTIDDDDFWDHIEVACGNLWMPEGATEIRSDACGIFWDEHRSK